MPDVEKRKVAFGKLDDEIADDDDDVYEKTTYMRSNSQPNATQPPQKV